MPRITAGRFITLSKYENLGLVGARRMAIEQRTGKTLDPYVPPKIYLFVEKGGVNKFCGLDLHTRSLCWFRHQTGKWYQFDPGRPQRMIDAWGWFDLAPLQKPEARKLMRVRLNECIEKARTARKTRADYKRFCEIVLKKAA